MKKLLTGVLTTALVLSIGAATVFAAGNGRGHHFADTDSNSICDYAGTARRYADTDNDGLCDYTGSACRYTDEDGDGLCDSCDTAHSHRSQGRVHGHRSTAGTRPQNGSGYRHGGHGSHHR